MLLSHLSRHFGFAMPAVTDVQIESVCWDSRRVTPQSLFLAVAGEQFDPHDEVARLLSDGRIAAALTQRDLHLPGAATLRDLARQEGPLAAEIFGNPSTRLRLVGVTGTNGKTSTVQCLDQIYRHLGYTCATIGTLGCTLQGEPVEILPNTTPRAAHFQYLLRRALDAGVDYVFAEVSSHALSLQRVDGSHFHGAIFTNFSEDHLDFHQSMDAYWLAKMELFDRFQPRIALGPALARSAGRWQTWGLDRGLDWQFEHPRIRPNGIALGLEGQRFHCRLRGAFNLENLQAALAFARADGQALQALVPAVRQLQPIPGRFTHLLRPDGLQAILDYAHTPDALERLLRAARPICQGRLWLIFGCGGDRDTRKRPLMGALAEQLADAIVITDDNPRTENPESIRHQIRDGMQSAPIADMADRSQAIEWVCQRAEMEDLILIAGKGHEDYQIYGRQRIPFSDTQAFMQAERKPTP